MWNRKTKRKEKNEFIEREQIDGCLKWGTGKGQNE